MISSAVLLVVVLWGAIPASADVIHYSYSSSGCFSSSSQPAESEAPQCPLPQVLRWSFVDGILRAEFSVRANCCPREDRFEVESWGMGDTLVIAVADTAPDECRCTCPYLITVEYPRLAGERYTLTALPWGDYELFAPTPVERGGEGETEPVESIYRRFRSRTLEGEAP